MSFHGRFLSLVSEIERQFPVNRWFVEDVPVWPLARLQLHNDMFWENAGGPQVVPGSLPYRTIAALATPLTNIWKSRGDFAHWLAHPAPADAIFLGDGVSLDRIDGRWQDRYGEPVMGALERRGIRTFLMQGGDLRRLPWRRATYPANVIAVRSALRRSIRGPNSPRPLDLPSHGQVLQFLSEHGVRAPSLQLANLKLQTDKLSATAAEFERVLRVVRPKIAFTVTYYAGLGAAFLLACRRQKIFSIDLQHCPQLGAHKAYNWGALPPHGYATLPALFWNWSEQEAADVARWAGTLPLPWHRSVHGGHTQLGPFLDDNDPATREWDRKFRAVSNGATFDREILVALQPIPGHRTTWERFSALVESCDPTWRWWIRRHPAAHPAQDLEMQNLLSLRRPNVIIEEASSLPLPALLRHMSVLISLASGAAAEAAAFGVPSLFLSEEAVSTFLKLIDQGQARIADLDSLRGLIEYLPKSPVRPPKRMQPDLDDTLHRVEIMAQEYAQLFDHATPPS